MKNKYDNKNHYKSDFAKNFSDDLYFINAKIKKNRPDLIIVLGDRYEMILGPISAIPYNIPVIHFFGGAVTEGAIDELIRHAITKMSYYHFVLLKLQKRLLE